MNKLTVLLADDHTVVRQGLCALLNSTEDITVTGQAATGRQAVELARRLRPDVIVMDIAMPDLNGVEATREIMKLSPDAKVVILSAHRDEEYVRSAIEAGVKGYLLKCATEDDLLEAIREAHQGNAVFSPCISKQMLEYCRGHGSVLTARELEVLRLIAQGRLNKQIAADLAISIKTVETHRQNLMDKLNIHATAGLTRYAVAKGLVAEEPT